MSNDNQVDLILVRMSELDLPFKQAGIMDFHNPVKRIVGSKLIVGYLVDDEDCMNPLEDCDGNGGIYSSHRHSTTHREMQEALALTSEWGPDVELVRDHLNRVRRPWINAAKQSVEFQVWADETAGPRARLDEAYYERRAAKLWRTTGGEYVYGEVCIDDFDFTEDVLREIWEELRSEGVIGDRDAMLLDCYEHSGQSWSLSGEGMQCRWDTARGAGVWVPDECARDEISRRAPVYAYGRVLDNRRWTRGSGRNRYYAVLDDSYGAHMSPQYEHWHEAFEWLSKQAKKLKLPRRKLAREAALLEGRRRAAEEIARSALEEYNLWLRGSTYGVVVATYNNVGTIEEPEWEFEESDECWGYIGDDYAMEEVAMTVNAIAEGLEAKAA